MSTNARCVLALPLLLSCGTSVDEPDLDAGVARDAGVCRLVAPEAVSVRAGGLLTLEAQEAGGAEVTIAWPEAFVVRSERQARAPYEVDRFDVAVEAACGDARTIAVTTTAIEFEPLAAWAEGDGPDAREHPAMWIDPSNPDRLFLYGGFSFVPRQLTVVDDLWSYDLVSETWTEVDDDGAPALASGRHAVIGDTLYYEGGRTPNETTPSALVSLDTRAATWSDVATRDAPAGGASLHGLVARGDQLVSFGGIRGNRLSSDVWTVDLVLGAYTSVTLEGAAPSPRYGFFVADDRANDRVVVFSGAQAGTRANPVNAADDTWVLELGEPMRWTMLFDASASPPGRRNGCSALDEAGRRFFVWGGTSNGRTSQPGLWVLDLDRGAERWTYVETERGDGLVRSSCSAVYDPARRRILFGFGNTTSARYADLVALPLD